MKVLYNGVVQSSVVEVCSSDANSHEALHAFLFSFFCLLFQLFFHLSTTLSPVFPGPPSLTGLHSFLCTNVVYLKFLKEQERFETEKFSNFSIRRPGRRRQVCKKFLETECLCTFWSRNRGVLLSNLRLIKFHFWLLQCLAKLNPLADQHRLSYASVMWRNNTTCADQWLLSS